MDQACCTRMPEVVAWLLRQTRPPQDSPIVLFGHSMGSLIAYELARAWRAEGVDLRLLVVSGHGAPDLSRPRPALHRLSDAALLVELARQGGTPDEVMTNPEMMALFLPILRADFGICETYRPTAAPPLDVNILAVGGADDADYAPPSLRAWHRYTDRRFQHVTLPGGHFFINTHRDELFGALRRALTETLGSRR